MISSHSVASNCSVPLVFLRSREISLMVKSVWKGAICSRRIKRCFIKKSCPSTWVQSITRKNICITCEEQPLSEKNNFNTFTCVSYLPLTSTNNLTNRIFLLVCSAINYIPALTSSKQYIYCSFTLLYRSKFYSHLLENRDYRATLHCAHVSHRHPLFERHKIILHKGQEVFHVIHIKLKNLRL